MSTRIINSIVIAALCLLSVFSTGVSVSQPETSTFTFPAAMPPHPRLQQAIQSGLLQQPAMLTSPQNGFNAAGMQPSSLTGSIKALAVVVNFTDNPSTVNASYFDNLIFASPVDGRGSVRDYFNEVSYGQIDIITVNLPSDTGWQTAPMTYAKYVNNEKCWGGYPYNCQKLAEDIATQIDELVNFADYDNDGDNFVDNLMIIHAGPGAEYTGNTTDIWSHSWNTYTPQLKDGVYVSAYTAMPEYWQTVSSGNSDMTIGVFAHEMGHGFWGLPDLYDYGYDSSGIGGWSLMAGGSWNGASSTGGDSPAWPDAYNRILMGVTTPTSLSGTTASLTIPQAYNNPAPDITVFKLKTSTLASNEYWLIENRQQTAGSYDQYLPGNGLLIWHVDASKSDNDTQCIKLPNCTCGSTHYMVALEQADGLKEMEKNTDSGDTADPFPGSTNKLQFTSTSTPDAHSYTTCNESHIRITNISNSGPTMTASVQVGAPAISINDMSFAEGNSGTTQALFTLSLSNGGALDDVTVNYATANGTATAGQDYTAASDTLTFDPTVTTRTVAVDILGDTAIEPDEIFFVNLTTPANATISDSQGVATILADDFFHIYYIYHPMIMR